MTDFRSLSTPELELLNEIALASSRPLGLDARIEAFKEKLSPEQRTAYRMLEDGFSEELAAIQAATWRAALATAGAPAGR